MVFASLGFLVIVLAFVTVFLSDDGGVDSANVITLVAGTIVEVISALFFVQTNRARVLMVDFFDRLRVDRKLREALSLAEQVSGNRAGGAEWSVCTT